MIILCGNAHENHPKYSHYACRNDHNHLSLELMPNAKIGLASSCFTIVTNIDVAHSMNTLPAALHLDGKGCCMLHPVTMACPSMVHKRQMPAACKHERWDPTRRHHLTWLIVQMQCEQRQCMLRTSLPTSPPPLSSVLLRALKAAAIRH